MVEPKQKPAGKTVHTADKVRIPRTAMRAAWLRTREGTRRLTAKEQQDGQYQDAAAQEEHAADTAVSAAETIAGATLRGGKNLAQRVAQNRQKARGEKPVQEQAVPVAAEEPDVLYTKQKPYYAGQEVRQGQRTKPYSAVTASAQTQDVRQGVPRHEAIDRLQAAMRKKSPPRQAPLPKTAPNTAKKAAEVQKARQTAARAARLAKQTAQAAKETAQKVSAVVRAGLKALWAATQTLAAAIAAGGTTALLVIVVLCMVAMVAGSAFGIFFAAEPTGDGISVAQAITELNEEYQERLQEIESEEEYDRQEIESNDGSYAIAWQDVLAVFAARTSGAEDGAPVAYLDEENLERLRQIMWDMNEITWEVETQTHEVETTPATDTTADATAATTGEDFGTRTASASERSGGEGTPASTTSGADDPSTDNSDENEDGPATTTVTETVLILTLHHKTAEEMREEYRFNPRQDEYLTLLSAADAAPLWADLLGGFEMGELGGEILTPGSDTTLGGGALQWPLPVAGTITSPQGYRTDPITGEVSYHSGTDIAVPEGTPILAAADGTVTIANALDSWGGSYGYHVKLDHGGGFTTLYAHCSSICVTAGQKVKAGEVIAYVGHTGRATGPHLHFEVQGLA